MSGKFGNLQLLINQYKRFKMVQGKGKGRIVWTWWYPHGLVALVQNSYTNYPKKRFNSGNRC